MHVRAIAIVSTYSEIYIRTVTDENDRWLQTRFLSRAQDFDLIRTGWTSRWHHCANMGEDLRSKQERSNRTSHSTLIGTKFLQKGEVIGVAASPPYASYTSFFQGLPPQWEKHRVLVFVTDKLHARGYLRFYLRSKEYSKLIYFIVKTMTLTMTLDYLRH